ncbi:hypothetical protein P3L10_025885 [Capsicum annuum]
MARLTVLDLRRNNFTGRLPPLCAQSTSLSTIILNSNQFEGPVPASLLNCTGLEVLDLGTNAINDTFPAWLGTLQELQVRIFDLSLNEFSGSLPAKVFGNFKAMIKLDGEDTGEIKYMEPSMTSSYSSYEVSVSLVIKGQDIELEKITTIMTTIDLSSNHFEGVIPKTLKDLGYSISHATISKQCRTSVPSHVPQPLDSEEDEDESYFFSGFTWESVVIGYGFGLIVGTIGWSLMFKAGKPKWFVEFFEGIIPHYHDLNRDLVVTSISNHEGPKHPYLSDNHAHNSYDKRNAEDKQYYRNMVKNHMKSITGNNIPQSQHNISITSAKSLLHD